MILLVKQNVPYQVLYRFCHFTKMSYFYEIIIQLQCMIHFSVLIMWDEYLSAILFIYLVQDIMVMKVHC